MNNLTKFLKNKNTVTILGVLACLAILLIAYNMRINQKTALIDVFYAKETIQPKTLITEDMVAKTSVPESFIKGNYYRSYDQIVGKYSNYNSLIAAGSIFYTDLLVEESSLPDAILYEINEGERLYSFPANIESTYGNSIMPGNKVDVYVKMYEDNGKLVYGELMQNIEVLGVKDSAGRNVFENTEESREPSFVYFSLPEVKYLLLSSLNYLQEVKANNLIEIVLVPNTATFDVDDPLATEVTSDYFYNYVLSNISTIDDQKDLYNQLINEMGQEKLERKNREQAKELEDDTLED